jgi:two-component system, chemotaxis family, sensor kinase CheA
LSRLSHPNWFTEHKENTKAVADKVVAEEISILLAEDSSFFRKQVAGYLKDAGYCVTACEDGLAAWNTLKTSDKHFDLVVTDLEMPNMNGFELARSIKDDPNHRHLPIIALTSLASEEDMQRGYESGIDDYQIKLDRERLMNSVINFLQSMKTNSEMNKQHAFVG